jgi:hypothetical protein
MAKDQPKADALARSVTEILATGGASLATGGTPEEALLAAIRSGISNVFAGAFDGRDRREARAWAAYFDAFLAGEKDPETALALLAYAAENGVVQEMVAESARAIAECLSPSVVPVMGKMTHQYKTENRKVDGFFRGVRRLLTDLTDDEVRDLRTLMRLAADAKLPEHHEVIELNFINLPPSQKPQLAYLRPSETAAEKQTGMHQREALGDVPHALRLFQLLKTNDLGRDEASGANRLTGPQAVVLRRETVNRLLRLLF